MLWMICSFFSALNLPPSLFCSNKNKFEVLHLFDLINDVQFPLLLCLSLQLESKKYFNLQHFFNCIPTCHIVLLLPHYD